ncbi:DNA-binding protein HMf-1 [uncultured archaeon]|nr:DNA-binding protein HMf-1 [uncultured archaeon]
MANIPKQAIKKLIKKYFKVNISDDGAVALAKILESKAKKISKFAVKNAKKDKRDRVTKKDIEDYVLKIGLHEND